MVSIDLPTVSLNIYNATDNDSKDIEILLSSYFLDRDEIPYEDIIIARNEQKILVGLISNRKNEIHTIAVHPSYKNKGIGKTLINFMFDKIKNDFPETKILFTKTTSSEFFKNCGFVECKNENLKKELWEECDACDKFDVCTQKVLLFYF